ncbi:alpha/beta hydrolase family protein [Streptomyces sp. N2-109]|uniref:Alpha/beta hydrolase family protein n=1 Tax=Streptomyces gossypii TaxID=2883101 RepID=A0ABT2JQE2_9ACTN|nr:alpha/beta hydrolase family protein [Streptomyces gossypii]MCT2589729.1 alpha/beta hydrolase family protein [Streptomyces gossypii]
MGLRLRGWWERGGRLRRGVLATIVAAAVVVPLSGAGQARATPAPAPPRLPALTAANLAEHYAADRAAARAAARMAQTHGDGERAANLYALASPQRQLLAFDGRGDGRAVEVLGELATADRIAVLVPGADTTVDTFDPSEGTDNPAKSLAGAARSLYAEARRQAPRARVAVVAWLGYDTPGTVSTEALTTGRADDGAVELRSFINSLRHVTAPDARFALLCHSYGSAVCGRAADELPAATARGRGAAAVDRAVTDIAFFGSPGTGAESADALGTEARVWAGRGGDDWIEHVPHAGPDLLGTHLGLGPDPLSGDFGARRFAAGDGGHSDYLRPGSESLRNLARIARGESSAVGHG